MSYGERRECPHGYPITRVQECALCRRAALDAHEAEAHYVRPIPAWKELLPAEHETTPMPDEIRDMLADLRAGKPVAVPRQAGKRTALQDGLL